MSTRGIGSKLMSAFGSIFAGRGAHLPRKSHDANDTDGAEVAMWEDWFFEAPPAAGGQPMMLRNANVQHSAYRGWRHAG